VERNVIPSTSAYAGSDLAAAMPIVPMVRRIRRIGVGSAFRIGAILSALIFAIIGIFFVLFGVLGAGMMAAFGAPAGETGGALAFSLIMYVVGVVAYAVIGGIFFALYAWLYNIVAGWVGGISVELSAD
jgi:hypothetical protein